MKKFLPIAALLMSACHSAPTPADKAADSLIQAPDSLVFKESIVPSDSESTPHDTISGHFSGKSQEDTAMISILTPASNTEAPEDAQDKYAVSFNSQSGIPALPTFWGAIYIVNEGDLNGDGKDDITVFNEPLHGCTFSCTTWYLAPNNEWKQLFSPLLVPTACDPITDSAMQARVFKENGKIYRWEEDVNDEDFAQKKVEVKFN
ncbi:hypothetical protein CLV59_104228 [Chitinophaga dinghuensis]|uniref:Lipoprotein n=1 Tax=Chitinophaga dinghuensis TaxID=1539050 RepID=A0A327W052_9BACT|nr:hypothetical protein [Chitinophaga dinghuensis]RAJ82003.1 hypothetical protein CLV59_104228 [Chitinophaga dinghuensis]